MGAANNHKPARPRMTLSTSRQQFLAYESHNATEEIQYGRRGGVFISTCVCISFIIFAVISALLVGLIVYYITYFKIAHQSADFWDETEPFGQNSLSPSPDLRLPAHVAPSFYRLKLKADLETSEFTGDVSITIRASKKVKEIILHSKNLTIIQNAKLTEQIYEKVGTLHMPARKRRDTTNSNATEGLSNNTEVPTTSSNPLNTTTDTESLSTSSISVSISEVNVTSNATDKPENIQIIPTVPSTSPPPSFAPTQVDTSVVHSNVRNIKILTVKQSTGDRLILTLGSMLKPNVDYILELSFKGTISNSLTGFYKSTYINEKNEVKNLGVTQFEPTSARAAFPCFDEPGFKAKFEISIAHSRNISVLSNMKVASTEFILEEPGWQWTHFERSVSMSTYLVAYILSDFESLETTYLSSDNVTKTIKVWTRPNMKNKAKYALSITPKLLSYYEEVFGVPYALDKIDLIAIPDFSSGAMENWGLVTFRETTLLLDSEDSAPRDKQGVCIDVAHELAHQWFGNLVTMAWWTELWLNEGFATYIEYVGVDHIEPGWNMLESFTRDKMDLLRTDALKNTSPVSRKVVDAAEISQKFDEISYTKGANLIRMLNHTISEAVFKKGLSLYLKKWMYKNAEENDLWWAMSSADNSSGVSVVEFMNTWTRQPGYPRVMVNRNYDTGNVHFEQALFTTDLNPKSKLSSQLWHIPISYATTDVPEAEWSTAPKLWLKQKSLDVTLPLNNSQALYVNVDGIGYYRVNYDQRNWELLSSALKSGTIKSPSIKAQLIDDAFNLAKLGQLNYSLAFELTTSMIDGDDPKMVWDLLLNNMAFLKYNLKSTSGYGYFQDYVKLLISKQLKKVNYGLSQPRDDNEALMIENLLSWECMVEADRCIRWARNEYDKWMNQTDYRNNTIPGYLRPLVYSMALKFGSRAEFQFLWRVFNSEERPAARSNAGAALTATNEPALITMLLENSLTTIPKQYAVAVWNVQPPLGTKIAQDFLIKNFDRVYETFTQMDSFTFPTVLNGCFGFISDEEELMKFKSFALKHKDKLMPMSQTLQKLVDSANLRIQWSKYAPGINRWFRDYLQERSAANPSTNVVTTETIANTTSTNETTSLNLPANEQQLTESMANIKPTTELVANEKSATESVANETTAAELETSTSMSNNTNTLIPEVTTESMNNSSLA